MNSKLLREYLESVLGRSLDGLQPRFLTGWQTVEALWPLLELIQPLHHRLATLAYDPAFEPQADAAVEELTRDPNTDWANLPAGVLRVLSERLQQGITVAAANEAQGQHRFLPLPPGLGAQPTTVAAALFVLHGMKLLLPPGHQCGFSHPPTSAQAPLRPQ